MSYPPRPFVPGGGLPGPQSLAQGQHQLHPGPQQPYPQQQYQQQPYPQQPYPQQPHAQQPYQQQPHTQVYQQQPPPHMASYPRGVVPASTGFAVPPSVSGSMEQQTPMEELWIPEYDDAIKLDQWFEELDKDRSGSISGAVAVGFLMRSNLPKQILRDIWALVDTMNRGSIDNQQFYKIMRLVAIACSPTYAGSKPTIERYKSTLASDISLPPMGMVAPPAAASVNPSSVSIAPSGGGSVGGNLASPVRPTGGMATGSTPMAWTPSPVEMATCNAWFEELDVAKAKVISGAVAVGFLMRSNLHKQILRDIWALVDSENRGSIDIHQFYKIMRLVAISCSPQYANQMPSWEVFQATGRVPFPLPPMGGADSAPPAVALVSAAGLGPMSAPSPLAGAPTPPTEWAPSPAELSILSKWFAELDSNHSGLISGAVAVGFLMRSNLHKQILRDIWALVDSENRGSIDIHQFYKIMRLVAISCSPQYANQMPSWEMFQATGRVPFPLPPMGGAGSAPPALAPVSAAGLGPMSAPSPLAGAPVPNQSFEDTNRVLAPSGGTISNSSSVSDLSALSTPAPQVMASAISSDMLTIAGTDAVSTGGSITKKGWAPSQQEFVVLDQWFAELDSNHSGLISGAVAVGFLMRSNLHKQILRDIWALVDSENRGSIDIHQFYKIMRLVAISCSPQYANQMPSWEVYHATSATAFSLPLMTTGDVGNIPPEPLVAPVLQPILLTRPNSEVAPDAASEKAEEKTQEPPPIQWVPVGTDLEVLDNWFSELDTDRSGSISGAVAVGFLMRSNLPKQILRDVWALVDTMNRGSIDNQQFYKIMRLVAIACSPMYAGSKPTIERYTTTVIDTFYLPSMTPSSTAPEDYIAQPPRVVRNKQSESGAPQLEEGGEEFGDFTSTSAPVRSHARLHVHHPNIKNLDDFMTDLSSNPLAPKHASLKQQLASSDDLIHRSTSSDHVFVDRAAVVGSNRMSAFDALAEMDLQANTEEWDDFADETTAAPAPPPAASLVPEVDLFGAVGAATDTFAYGAPTADPSAEMCYGAPLAPVADEDRDRADSFGDFEDAPTKTAPENDRFESFGDFARTSAQVDPVAQTPFDPFGEMNMDVPLAPLSSGEAGGGEDARGRVDSFGDFGSAAPVPTPDAAAPNEDFFAASFSGSSSLPSIAPNATTLDFAAFGDAIVERREKAISIGSDDFGDFAESAGTEPAAIVSSAPAEGFAAFEDEAVEKREKAFSVGSDDFGDFADATGPEVGGQEETVNTDVIVQIAVEETKPSDLAPTQNNNFDFFADLIEPIDAPLEPMIFSMPTSTMLTSESKKSLIDINDLLSLGPATPTAPNPVQSVSPDNSRRQSESFAEYANAVNSDPIASSFIKSASAMSMETKQRLITADEQLPCPVGRAMNAVELEIIAKNLFVRNELQMALLCCRQCIAVKTVKELSVKKLRAVEDDDLELAIKLRDDINAAKDNICTIEEESVWLKRANELQQSTAPITDIKESIELIEMLNPNVASAAKNIFLADGFSIKAYYTGSAPGSENSNSALALLDDIRTALSVRRSLRLITALHTSHQKHAVYWKHLLAQVAKSITLAFDRVESFQVLSKLDRAAILAEAKMNMFLRGTIRVLEVGLWVAASCLEALVEVHSARQVAAQCKTLILAAEDAWGPIDYEHPLPTIEELITSGAEGSAIPGAVHCNLTLRPVYVKSKAVGGREKRVCGAAYCDYLGDAYMQPAISYWLKAVSEEPPQSDGRFE